MDAELLLIFVKEDFYTTMTTATVIDVRNAMTIIQKAMMIVIKKIQTTNNFFYSKMLEKMMMNSTINKRITAMNPMMNVIMTVLKQKQSCQFKNRTAKYKEVKVRK